MRKLVIFKIFSDETRSTENYQIHKGSCIQREIARVSASKAAGGQRHGFLNIFPGPGILHSSTYAQLGSRVRLLFLRRL
jgi:hypothetical protein